MERLWKKFTLLSALAALLLLVGTGTASAHAMGAAHTTVSASQLNPAACSYTKESQWTWNDNHGPVTIIKWRNNCNGQRHCEGIDVGYDNVYTFELKLKESSSTGVFIGETVELAPHPFLPNQYVNTLDLDPVAGATFACSGYNYNE